MAEILLISPATMQRRIKEGFPPFDKKIKIGRRVLFPMEIIEEIKAQVDNLGLSTRP
jgi:hypothetical protein